MKIISAFQKKLENLTKVLLIGIIKKIQQNGVTFFLEK